MKISGKRHLQDISSAIGAHGLMFQEVRRYPSGKEEVFIPPVPCGAVAFGGMWMAWAIPDGERIHSFEIREVKKINENVWLLFGPEVRSEPQRVMRISPVDEKEDKKALKEWRGNDFYTDQVRQVEQMADDLTEQGPSDSPSLKIKSYRYSQVYLCDGREGSDWFFIGCFVQAGDRGSVIFVPSRSSSDPEALERKYGEMITAAMAAGYTSDRIFNYLVEEYSNGMTISISEPAHMKAVNAEEVTEWALEREERRQRRRSG